MSKKLVLRHATICPVSGDDALELILHGAVVIEDDRIVWVGSERDLPSGLDAGEIDCGGRLVTPGLIDCHTHLVYDGNRANEFEMRLAGAGYEEIARAGGGILSSVAATEAEFANYNEYRADLRDAICATSERAAIQKSLTTNHLAEQRRFRNLLVQGITTVEVKSGYGVRAETEAFLLNRARNMSLQFPVEVYRTYLAAHVMPQDSGMSTGEWVQHLADDDVDTVYALTQFDAIDMFCEGIAFSPDDLKPLLQKAKDLEVDIRIHADQLSDLNGAALAAEWGALSADHLEYTNEAGVQAMATSGTVAVMLPGAFYFIHETQKPPIQHFRDHGVPMAIATDHNPGTSPLNSLLLATNMAATLFGMTVEECIRGITINAAKALGRQDSIGSLDAGKFADVAIWEVQSPSELVYNIGGNPLWQRIWHGRPD